MKKNSTPLLLLGLLYLCFYSYLAFSAGQLPERVATHFNMSGQPDGWMSRSACVIFMAVFGAVFPLIVVGLCFLGRYVPDKWQNLPNREYWLAPQRREETFAYIFRQSLWFACLQVGFVIGLQFSTVQANQHTPPHLSSSLILIEAGCFVAATIAWGVNLLRHFSRAD